jgi:hypothetical protein
MPDDFPFPHRLWPNRRFKPLWPESRCVCCRRNLLGPLGDFAAKQKAGPKGFANEEKIWLAKRLIWLAKRFCFARRPRRLLKSYRPTKHLIPRSRAISKIYDPLSFALFRSPSFGPLVGPSFNLVFQNLLIARIGFQGKPKGSSPDSGAFVRFPRNRSSSFHIYGTFWIYAQTQTYGSRDRC